MPKVNNRLPFDVVFKVSKTYKRGGAKRPTLTLGQVTYAGDRSAVFGHIGSGLAIIVNELEARGPRVEISLLFPREKDSGDPVHVSGAVGHTLADSYIRELRRTVERRGLELRLTGDAVKNEPRLNGSAYELANITYSVHRPAVGQRD